MMMFEKNAVKRYFIQFILKNQFFFKLNRRLGRKNIGEWIPLVLICVLSNTVSEFLLSIYVVV